MNPPSPVSSPEQELAALRDRLLAIESATTDSTREHSIAIVCFSGEWDRLFAAFTIANGGLALGMEVHMFFTFWGATAVRNATAPPDRHKSLLQRALGWMLPKGPNAAPLSKFHFCGLGKLAMLHLMRKHGVPDLDQLIADARELGAHLHFCDTSLQLFGWSHGDLIDDDPTRRCGVSSFLSRAIKSKTVLFI